MKTSKIIKCKSNLSEKNNKRYYDIEMENGDKGTIANDKENAYVEGQDLNYNLGKIKNEATGMYRINEDKPSKGFPKKNYNAEFAIKALECASRMVGSEGPYEIFSVADKYFDRLKKKSLSSNQSNND